MTRTRTAPTLTTLALAGLLVLPACGAAPAAADGVADEAIALQAVGLPAAAPSPAPAEGRPGVRKLLRENTLHGETTVRGKAGVRTIVVQRGTVTAAAATSLTVRSADGYTLTWTVSDRLRVVRAGAKADLSAVEVGAEVGVAGARSGDAPAARLIVLP